MEDKMFDLLSKLYSEFTEFKADTGKKLDGIEKRMGGFEKRMDSIENTVTRIEHTHSQKLDALFDGYKQNSDKLDRVENEVMKHEEVILRRIK